MESRLERGGARRIARCRSMAEKLAATEPSSPTAAATAMEVDPTPLDAWTKLRAHSDTELKVRSCSAANALRKAFLLQLSARLESDEERRVDALARCHSDGPGAWVSADQYAAVLRELCQSARTRLATSVQQVPGPDEGEEESAGACLARVVGAHADALDKHLSLAEQLGHCHRAAALAAARVTDPLALQAAPASSHLNAGQQLNAAGQPALSLSAPVPKSTMRAFRDVGIEQCLIAHLDEADAAILWDALCLDIEPPVPWDGQGVLVSFAEGPMSRPADFGISEDMMEHLTADELADLRATLAAPQPGRDASLPPRKQSAITDSGGDGSASERGGAGRPDRGRGCGTRHGQSAEQGSVAVEGMQTAEQAVRVMAAGPAAGGSGSHRGTRSLAAEQQNDDARPGGRSVASSPFVLGDSRGARVGPLDASVESEVGSQIHSYRTRLSQLGGSCEVAPGSGGLRAGEGDGRYPRTAESGLSTRDATEHWEVQSDAQQRGGQGWRHGSSQSGMPPHASVAPMDDRQRSAAEAHAGVEEWQREAERRQHRAIDEAIAVRNGGGDGRSGRPMPHEGGRAAGTACRALPAHQAGSAQPGEQSGRQRHIAPSLALASAPAPAFSSLFSSFSSWFG